MRSGGPVVELGVGTGRIAVPTAAAGVRVIGVDASAEMLAVAAEQLELGGVAGLVDLRHGDLREPPVEGEFPLVTIPFRTLLHMETDRDRRAALEAARRLLSPGGRFVFDVFTPSDEDIADTHGRWLEREPGIWERADWDLETRTLILRVRGETGDVPDRASRGSPSRWKKGAPSGLVVAGSPSTPWDAAARLDLDLPPRLRSGFAVRVQLAAVLRVGCRSTFGGPQVPGTAAVELGLVAAGLAMGCRGREPDSTRLAKTLPGGAIRRGRSLRRRRRSATPRSRSGSARRRRARRRPAALPARLRGGM